MRMSHAAITGVAAALWVPAASAKGTTQTADDTTHRKLQENILCQLPDCEFHNGTYMDSYGDTRAWQAFVPSSSGAKACPSSGCPLYYAFDGSGDPHFSAPYAQSWMMAMLARGYVGVTADYASGFEEYGFCYGQDYLPFIPVEGNGFAEYGVVDKAGDVFGRVEGSVMWQLCDGPQNMANCDLGVAVSGISQGSQIALLGSNYDKRITAALLWATGDDVQNIRDFLPIVIDSDVLDVAMDCMDTVQLPSVRRRYISGDADQYFGRGAEGTIDQIQRMSRNYYNCTYADRDCLTREPETVPDAYTGTGEIANEGGYYIVEGSDHTAFLRAEKGTGSDYKSVEDIYGFESSFDWLARTGRLTYTVPRDGFPTPVTMSMDLSHWRLISEDAEHGLHVEWADVNGAFGQRYNLGGKDEFSVEHDFCCGQVPVNNIGFRVSAVSADAAFLDKISVAGPISVSYGEDDSGGWCISLDPADSFLFVNCHGDTGDAVACVDFCLDGAWQICDDAIELVSKCYNGPIEGVSPPVGIESAALTKTPTESNVPEQPTKTLTTTTDSSPITSAPTKAPTPVTADVTLAPTTREYDIPSEGGKHTIGNVSSFIITAVCALFMHGGWS